VANILFNFGKFIILENKYGDCHIKDCSNNKFYYKRRFYFSRQNYEVAGKIIKFSFGDFVFLCLIMFSIYALIQMMGMDYGVPHSNLQRWFVFIFIMINVVLHELAHISVLRFFGGLPGKVRVGFFLVFPVIKVDTSDVYILPRFRRACVCYAGILINILIGWGVVMFARNIDYLVPPVLFMTLSNLIPIPIVKNDGYNILMNSVFIKVDFSKKVNNFIKVLEIAIMIVISIMWLLLLYGYVSDM
jgi:putative peptide zinc metalloprotease protein